MAGKKNKLGRQYGWPGFVVPCDMLAVELLSRTRELRIDSDTAESDEDVGWRRILADRAALILDTTSEAVIRRLYDVLNERAMIVGATIAESMLLAVGINMDRETNLPTLPGCKSSAEDMALVHVEETDPSMTPDEQRKLAASLLNFSIGFICGEAWFEELEAAEAVCQALRAAALAPVYELGVEQLELVAA